MLGYRLYSIAVGLEFLIITVNVVLLKSSLLPIKENVNQSQVFIPGIVSFSIRILCQLCQNLTSCSCSIWVVAPMNNIVKTIIQKTLRYDLIFGAAATSCKYCGAELSPYSASSSCPYLAGRVCLLSRSQRLLTPRFLLSHLLNLAVELTELYWVSSQLGRQ